MNNIHAYFRQNTARERRLLFKENSTNDWTPGGNSSEILAKKEIDVLKTRKAEDLTIMMEERVEDFKMGLENIFRSDDSYIDDWEKGMMRSSLYSASSGAELIMLNCKTRLYRLETMQEEDLNKIKDDCMSRINTLLGRVSNHMDRKIQEHNKIKEAVRRYNLAREQLGELPETAGISGIIGKYTHSARESEWDNFFTDLDDNEQRKVNTLTNAFQNDDNLNSSVDFISQFYGMSDVEKLEIKNYFIENKNVVSRRFGSYLIEERSPGFWKSFKEFIQVDDSFDDILHKEKGSEFIKLFLLEQVAYYMAVRDGIIKQKKKKSILEKGVPVILEKVEEDVAKRKNPKKEKNSRDTAHSTEKENLKIQTPKKKRQREVDAEELEKKFTAMIGEELMDAENGSEEEHNRATVHNLKLLSKYNEENQKKALNFLTPKMRDVDNAIVKDIADTLSLLYGIEEKSNGTFQFYSYNEKLEKQKLDIGNVQKALEVHHGVRFDSSGKMNLGEYHTTVESVANVSQQEKQEQKNEKDIKKITTIFQELNLATDENSAKRMLKSGFSIAGEKVSFTEQTPPKEVLGKITELFQKNTENAKEYLKEKYVQKKDANQESNIENIAKVLSVKYNFVEKNGEITHEFRGEDQTSLNIYFAGLGIDLREREDGLGTIDFSKLTEKELENITKKAKTVDEMNILLQQAKEGRIDFSSIAWIFRLFAEMMKGGDILEVMDDYERQKVIKSFEETGPSVEKKEKQEITIRYHSDHPQKEAFENAHPDVQKEIIAQYLKVDVSRIKNIKKPEGTELYFSVQLQKEKKEEKSASSLEDKEVVEEESHAEKMKLLLSVLSKKLKKNNKVKTELSRDRKTLEITEGRKKITIALSKDRVEIIKKHDARGAPWTENPKINFSDHDTFDGVLEEMEAIVFPGNSKHLLKRYFHEEYKKELEKGKVGRQNLNNSVNSQKVVKAISSMENAK